MSRQPKNWVVMRLRLVYLATVLLIISRAMHVSGKMQVGVNLGFLGDNLPSVSRTVELLTDLHAGAVRLYDGNPEVLKALRNRPQEVIVSVRNDQLQEFASSPDAADMWVQNHVVPFYPATKITFIAVGNEVLREGTIESDAQYFSQALRNVYGALVARNLHDAIKVISPLSGEILGTSWPPSRGYFEHLEYIRPLLQFLQDTGSTFFINLYPYYAHIADSVFISFEYAAFQATEPIFIDPQSNMLYYNLFEAMVDAAYNAMEDLGFPDLPLVVGETGWPSGGGQAATIQNAELFNNNLIKHVSSKGTPQRPHVRTPVFIFALFNENQKPGPDFERYWGLLNADGTPVYPIDLADPNLEQQANPDIVAADAVAPPLQGAASADGALVNPTVALDENVIIDDVAIIGDALEDVLHLLGPSPAPFSVVFKTIMDHAPGFP
ncbi:unnamed protein product [Calypogeia fissa]